MAKGLKSRLTSYGDAEFALFLRRAFLKSAGYGDEVLDLPVVGIGSTASDFNPCHATAPQVIEAVKRGVLAAGGIPFVFPTISLHESFCSPTTMLLRNLMAMDVEEMLRAQPVDAAVLIGGCDKTVPAEIMGALSAGVPTLIEVVGAALAGMNEGERLGACTDCRRLWYARRANQITDQQLHQGHGRLIASHGTCTVMGTASTMACIAEALGLMLPGGASIPAVHAERLRHAEATGMRAVAMARAGGPDPRSVVTPAAIRNAMVVLAALGGSTNAVIHLAAIAGRVGLAMDLDELDRIGRDTPVLVDLKPVGTNYMEDFHAAGGLPALLRRLGGKIDTSAMTAAGDSIADMLKRWLPFVDDKIIRPPTNPVSPGEALTIVRGNLAPDGAVIKRAAADAGLMQHKGPALVFEGLEDLAKRIDDPALPVTKDHVLVLRNVGPIGAPGMPEAGGIPIPRKLAQAGVKDMVRVSDARMSGTAYGAIVLHVAPEAAVGGPLALVRDGDIVELNVPERRIDMLVDAAERERRRAAWRPPARPTRGYRRLYAEHVMQADKGCDFDFLRDDRLQA
jgi:dihydroxy-acid dehydratase